jgi:phage replication O-like protein O
MLNYYFVPIPNAVIDALLVSRMTGGQLRIVLWVLRKTLGWNQLSADASWYQIGKDLGLDRAYVSRDGRRLIEGRVLIKTAERLAVATDPETWKTGRRRPCTTGPRRTEIGTPGHRRGDAGAPLLRRAIDTLKDIRQVKTRETGRGSPYHPAGSARPIPGKYERL